ncbi:hypothetical protein BKA61DRAFT_693253 [Leptodontidium sp. MPI-SDFR-AT-0119]|nr:hypothetical protein BKA61DRAFT_693253 [Leptodontidium sp. MPI-SDFR-AT-0119]
MEIASGVIGVVGLSLQLGKAIKDVCDLLDSIKDAPKDLATLNRELKVVELILKSITRNEPPHETRDRTTEIMDEVQEDFWEALNELKLITADIAIGLAAKSKARRQWTKVDWAWRAEKIRKLKLRLQDAKFNLLLVRILPDLTTITSIPGQDTLGSLITISSGTQPVMSASTISPEQVNTEPVVAEAVQAVAAFSIGPPDTQIQSNNSMRAHIAPHASTEAQFLLQSVSERTQSQSCESYSTVRRRPAGFPQCNTIRTKLGEVRYSVTTYRVIHPWQLGAKDPGLGTSAKIERKISCKFVPHQWLMKLGMKRALEINSQIRPNSSTIFEYCRRGNIEGVRSMLKRGKSSVYDINELGETPLHIAASWCQTEICNLLLDAGADSSKTDLRRDPKTPFHRACYPGEINVPDISNHQQMATLRLFINRGEDLSNVSCLYALMGYECRFGDTQELQIPSRWILNDVLPSLDPYSHDTKWWQVFLLAALRMTYPHPCFPQILRCCPKAAVRVDLLYWIFSLQQEHHPFRDRAEMQAEFESLVKYSGGVSFLQNFHGKLYSPLSAAMKSGQSFMKFRSLIRSSPWDLRDVVRSELQLWDQGWTEEALFSLFEFSFTPFSRAGFSNCKLGDHCANSLQCHWDYPFDKIARRFKERIDKDDPPDDEEILYEMAWHEALCAYTAGICWYCFVGRSKSRWKFLQEGPQQWDEEIKLFKIC